MNEDKSINPYGLTNKQLSTCDKALDSGFENVSNEEVRVLKVPKCQDYLDLQRGNLEKGHPLTYLKKLDICHYVITTLGSKRVIDGILDESIPIDERHLFVKALDALKKFIDVSNDMQGHRAPTKSMSAIIDISKDNYELISSIDAFRVKHEAKI